MTQQNDGGPAFPHERTEDYEASGKPIAAKIYRGLSMRDWFAGQALVSTIAHYDFPTEKLRNGRRDLVLMWAKESYRIADAMLAEREKGR